MKGKFCVVRMKGVDDDSEIESVEGPYTKKKATDIVNKKNLSSGGLTELANGHWESYSVAPYKEIKDAD